MKGTLCSRLVVHIARNSLVRPLTQHKKLRKKALKESKIYKAMNYTTYERSLLSPSRSLIPAPPLPIKVPCS